MHESVQPIAVHVSAAGIDRRRRSGVTRRSAVIDLATTGSVLATPNLGTSLSVERNNVTGPSRHEQQIFHARRRRDRLQKRRCAIRYRRQRDLELDGELRNVGPVDRRLQVVAAAVLHVAVEL